MLTQTLILAALAAGGSDPAAPTFEAPVRLMEGEQTMGHKRLYPSPVLHDLDGDGTAEMVIGDLIGYLTVSKRDGKSWSAPKPLEGADGKQLKFHNW